MKKFFFFFVSADCPAKQICKQTNYIQRFMDGRGGAVERALSALSASGCRSFTSRISTESSGTATVNVFNVQTFNGGHRYRSPLGPPRPSAAGQWHPPPSDPMEIHHTIIGQTLRLLLLTIYHSTWSPGAACRHTVIDRFTTLLPRPPNGMEKDNECVWVDKTPPIYASSPAHCI